MMAVERLVADNKWLASMVLVMVGLCGVAALSDDCPIVCLCKWKYNKQIVKCVDRALYTIPENVLPVTQVLDMSGNNLQILPSDMFIRANLLDLQKVYLRSCRIGQIYDHALNGLTNLIELDLSYNLLTSIPSTTFHDVPSLRDLSLANNPIQKIENHAFGTSKNLVKLDLSNCELQLIAPKAFEGIEQLESLKLNGNHLTELGQRTVMSLKRLNSIELHDNQWMCDCRLRDVKLWLQDNNIPSPVAPPVCSGGPKGLRGRTFAELDVDDFACKPKLLPMRRYVEATTGENATIVCRVWAVPPAVIQWYWNGRPLLNNSAFSSHQRVFIFVAGEFDRNSSLVLTNAQETDSSEFYCIAENRADKAEANFTLHVSLRTAGDTLGSGQIAGLSAALVVLILFILFIILVLLVRLRRLPFSESKTPGQVEASVNIEAATNNTCKTSSLHPGQHSDTSFTERGKVVTNDLKVACNPIQKPPRLSELSYSTNHYDGKGSVINTGATLTGTTTTSTTSTTNNPDLIKDTRRLVAAELKPNGHAIPQMQEKIIELRPGSGEYSREGCDSLYPSGLWEHQQPPSPTPEHFIRRTTSTGFNYDSNDKTPIISDGQSMGGSEEEDYCRTFPRQQHNSGYPPDYGLPIIPSGVDQKLREVGAVNGSTSPTTSPTSGTVPSAKTLRVWQRGVPVLPPVTALKRVLSRNSPDEGYQEGCGTDV